MRAVQRPAARPLMSILRTDTSRLHRLRTSRLYFLRLVQQKVSRKGRNPPCTCLAPVIPALLYSRPTPVSADGGKLRRKSP